MLCLAHKNPDRLASTATGISRRCSLRCPRPVPSRTARRCCPGAFLRPYADQQPALALGAMAQSIARLPGSESHARPSAARAQRQSHHRPLDRADPAQADTGTARRPKRRRRNCAAKASSSIKPTPTAHSSQVSGRISMSAALPRPRARPGAESSSRRHPPTGCVHDSRLNEYVYAQRDSGTGKPSHRLAQPRRLTGGEAGPRPERERVITLEPDVVCVTAML